MITVNWPIDECIQKTNNMVVLSCSAFPFLGMDHWRDSLQNLNFIKCSLHVLGGTLLNFYGNISVKFKIFAKPNSWEVTPSELLYHNISIDKNLPYVNRMVTTNFIVLNAFVFRVVLLIQLIQKILHAGFLLFLLMPLPAICTILEGTTLVKEV